MACASSPRDNPLCISSAKIREKYEICKSNAVFYEKFVFLSNLLLGITTSPVWMLSEFGILCALLCPLIALRLSDYQADSIRLLLGDS